MMGIRSAFFLSITTLMVSGLLGEFRRDRTDYAPGLRILLVAAGIGIARVSLHLRVRLSRDGAGRSRIAIEHPESALAVLASLLALIYWGGQPTDLGSRLLCLALPGSLLALVLALRGALREDRTDIRAASILSLVLFGYGVGSVVALIALVRLHRVGPAPSGGRPGAARRVVPGVRTLSAPILHLGVLLALLGFAVSQGFADAMPDAVTLDREERIEFHGYGFVFDFALGTAGGNGTRFDRFAYYIQVDEEGDHRGDVVPRMVLHDGPWPIGPRYYERPGTGRFGMQDVLEHKRVKVEEFTGPLYDLNPVQAVHVYPGNGLPISIRSAFPYVPDPPFPGFNLVVVNDRYPHVAGHHGAGIDKTSGRKTRLFRSFLFFSFKVRFTFKPYRLL